MLVDEFDFDLPPDLIAQEPSAERADARLLCLPRTGGPIAHRVVSDLSDLLREGDLLVVNDTRVFPARLLGSRLPGGGAVECLLVARLGEPSVDRSVESWEALMHPGQRLKPGSRVVFEGATTLHGEVLERKFFGRREIRLWTDGGTTVEDAVNRIGHMPLPPYIRRPDRLSDRERYQTIFARAAGSVAAPTAGLHFTPPLVAALRARGVRIAELTLHVGYGTFQPVRVAQVEEHRIEPERYEMSTETARAVNEALDAGRRVVAVGTTTTRTLEAIALEHGGRLVAGSGSTGLFIHPGFTFQVLSGLLTNFHLPRSSLLMLVAALGGSDRVLDAYRVAVAARYRFYSYGDAMLIL